MSELQVSVVVPVGRVDDELREQLDALAAQDYEGSWEIVLALNTSDPSQRAELDEVVADHERARVVDASDVRSASYARNQGAEAAKAAALAFCDGDDIAAPSWLSALVGALEQGVAVGGHLDEERLAVPGQENWRLPATPGALPRFLNHPYVSSANLAVSRRDFLAAGGFDISLIRCEDIAFSFQLIRNGVELKYQPDAVMHYRHRRGLKSLLQQHYLYGQGMVQVLARDGLPDDDGGRSGLGALRPNAQSVARWSVPQVLRRGALGIGRAVGMVKERVRRS